MSTEINFLETAVPVIAVLVLRLTLLLAQSLHFLPWLNGLGSTERDHTLNQANAAFAWSGFKAFTMPTADIF
ncbi:MAG: hypothetical protein RM347_029085 [Nostoc sp. ChiQUE02]|uniref:hypothetical protein n=1 Tax=Nostoc sp. ChiQUE02 TaxID=3075377 RepID=UPI002AD4E5CB|nr:hypothetical protein [Nostoc sp. ChiQUE02]MDZ8233335.1 hypothetical protein [Nostoc sp. ChiQUE02]